ncbi:MAG: hypothetical protein Unbinned1693contig1002_32 [Prokaryotic dsDNA virus sp.]|jgi:hypothetical protein|nr:MAG: hypothetical protein Unbinned1693contig1002_32 [Prokaryotic dsDNA virus sp.]|tara:strand:+ start:5889 stop:6128 length:240 start_codon:yes stop_codon:yes gene_type:complete
MKVDIEDFEAYEEVRISGETNMFDTNMVSMLSGLSKETIIAVMNNYNKLKEEYLKEQEMKEAKNNLSDVVSNRNGRLKE